MFVHFVGIVLRFPGVNFVGILVPFPGSMLCWYLGTFCWLIVHFVGNLVHFPGRELGRKSTHCLFSIEISSFQGSLEANDAPQMTSVMFIL